MLTKIILEGPMGKQFGREWELAVDSPAEALRMINANKPGVFAWIKANLSKYENYRVSCEYEDGTTEDLDNDTFPLRRKLKSIHFTPLIVGAGGVGKIVVGVVMIVAGVVFQQPWLVSMGINMAIGGVISALSPRPKKSREAESARSDGTSYFFDGPVNTTQQGVPVPLIYGRILTGSHAISANLTIDQLK